MKLSTIKIEKYMAIAHGDKRSVARLLLSGNPRHVDTVPPELLAEVRREIARME